MLATRLAATAQTVAAHLEAELAGLANIPVVEAMRYATRGGKGLRGFLVMESAALHAVPHGRAARM